MIQIIYFFTLEWKCEVRKDYLICSYCLVFYGIIYKPIGNHPAIWIPLSCTASVPPFSVFFTCFLCIGKGRPWYGCAHSFYWMEKGLQSQSPSILSYSYSNFCRSSSSTLCSGTLMWMQLSCTIGLRSAFYTWYLKCVWGVLLSWACFEIPWKYFGRCYCLSSKPSLWPLWLAVCWCLSFPAICCPVWFVFSKSVRRFQALSMYCYQEWG